VFWGSHFASIFCIIQVLGNIVKGKRCRILEFRIGASARARILKSARPDGFELLNVRHSIRRRQSNVSGRTRLKPPLGTDPIRAPPANGFAARGAWPWDGLGGRVGLVPAGARTTLAVTARAWRGNCRNMKRRPGAAHQTRREPVGHPHGPAKRTGGAPGFRIDAPDALKEESIEGASRRDLSAMAFARGARRCASAATRYAVPSVRDGLLATPAKPRAAFSAALLWPPSGRPFRTMNASEFSHVGPGYRATGTRLIPARDQRCDSESSSPGYRCRRSQYAPRRSTSMPLCGWHAVTRTSRLRIPQPDLESLRYRRSFAT
jgi:hypothetical protein